MDFDHKVFSFKNGLRLVVVPMNSVESATVLVLVRTGSRDEPAKLAGISHFLEHVVFKGTEKYPTHLDVTSTLDSMGAESNAFTSKEYTGFYVKAAVKHLEKSVDVLSQLLTKPRLRSDDIEREKGTIIEEINMYEDLPMRKVSLLFDTLIYGNNHLGRETIGSKKTVSSLTRENLASYLHDRYIGGRVIVGVAGGVDGIKKETNDIKELVQKKFSHLKKSSDNGWGKAVKKNSNIKKVLVFEKETGQAHVVLGVPAFKRGHKERYGLSVLSVLLGGNMSSRLFTEVREKRGLAYYVRSDVDVYFDTGSFSVHAGVDARKIDEALKVVVEQLVGVSEKSGKEKIGAKELVKAKEYLKGRIILELEDSGEVADVYVRRMLLERKVLTPREILKKIDRVNIEDVRRVARKLFAESGFYLSVVGPYKKKDGNKFQKLLNSF